MSATTLKLHARRANNSVIEKTSDLPHLAYYQSASNAYKVTKTTLGLKLHTPHGDYLFIKHPTCNYYWVEKGIKGIDNKMHKAHISMSKKMYLTLQWW